MIENIKKEAGKIDWKNLDAIIKFYERNLLFFDNYSLLKKQNEITDIIHIKLHYINALVSKKKYKKALRIVPQVDNLIEKLDSDSVSYDKFKVENLFYLGVIKGNKKDYKTSYQIFFKLLEIEPENELYKAWCQVMKMNIKFRYFRYVFTFGFLIVLGNIISELVFEYKFDNRIVIFGLILMGIGSVGPFVSKFFKLKKWSSFFKTF